jgi:cell division protein FtsN
MSSRNVKKFEFKLSRPGLAIFIFGISFILLFVFIAGVKVGRDIDSCTEKSTAGVQGPVKWKIRKSADAPLAAKEKEDDFKLNFYDDLTRKRKTTEKKIETTEKKIETTEKKAKAKSSFKGKYMVQAASFRDREKAETLRKKLLNMGYDPVVDVIDLKSKGRWFRVCLKGFNTRSDAKKVEAELEKKIRWLGCLVIRG